MKRRRTGKTPITPPSSKHTKLDVPQASKYWFWIKDEHSYDEDQLRTYIDDLPDHHRISALSPSGNNVGSVYFLKTDLKNIGTPVCTGFVVDKSKSAGDTICPISHDEYATGQPMLLNLNQRSYNRDAIVAVISNTLKNGIPLRLEDITIEPEQLPTMRLYPNRSLGRHQLGTVIKFSEEKYVIRAFDGNVKMDTNPEFWDAVAIPDHNGIWSLSSAAVAYGFAESDELPVFIIKNQICEERKFPWPHPKVNTGYAIFRNCLFRKCEIVMECWCGVVLHGCRFEYCTFIIKGFDHITRRSIKRCESHDYTVVNNVTGKTQQWAEDKIRRVFYGVDEVEEKGDAALI
jgi:hypothetical protein